MTAHAAPALEVVASFPEGSFLENLAMRPDGSILVTVLNRKQLWLVPASDGALPVTPLLLQGFGFNPTGIVEIEPDVFLLAESDFYGGTRSVLHRLDLRGWSPDRPLPIELAFTFPDGARALNGMCTPKPGIVLVADSFAGCIWRVDMPTDAPWRARVWLAHESMGYFPGAMQPEQPGVNGVCYAQRTSYLYFTATAKKLLMRVHVDPWTLEPDGHPGLVAAGRMSDDFCIDDDTGLLYVTTHRQNTIDRVAMDVARNSDFTDVLIGDPLDERLIGPSSIVWGRNAGEHGRVAFVITDGGTASPVGGVARPALLLRMTLPDRTKAP